MLNLKEDTGISDWLIMA